MSAVLNNTRPLTQRFACVIGYPDQSYVRLFNRVWRLPFSVPSRVAATLHVAELVAVNNRVHIVSSDGKLMPLWDVAGRPVLASQFFRD